MRPSVPIANEFMVVENPKTTFVNAFWPPAWVRNDQAHHREVHVFDGIPEVLLPNVRTVWIPSVCMHVRMPSVGSAGLREGLLDIEGGIVLDFCQPLVK